ncbi:MULTISPECIES: serine hydrolase domain-containing protein [Sphingobium]|uniref:serine hydrolase domain-containing protein n=1 Tax=Sphingobium TaxID=165695 RepID=UPI00159C9436|nr:serine hydrolase domain-containing protein [Sphingobium sp. 15-1]
MTFDGTTGSASSSGQVNGTVAPGYDAVRAAFEDNLASGLEIGASFAVYRGGRAVVDLWGGQAVGGAGNIAEDTLYGIFSATKGATAICIAMLVDRGKLDYEAPLSSYWPEFAAGGKAAITVGEMMSHQAGLTGPHAPVTLQDFIDHDSVAELLAAQTPCFRPGLFGYHALTFGVLADELVRRVDGRALGHFFEEEVRSELEIDVFLGLPLEQDHRYTTIVSAMDDSTMFYDCPNPSALQAMGNPPIIPEWPNDRIWREGGIPAGGGVASARGLAALYDALLSDNGPKLISPSALKQATRERVAGIDQCFGGVNRYAAGFSLNVGTMGSNPASFGHAGFGGSMAFADPTRRLGVGYTTNQMLNPDWQAADPRLTSLLRALYKAEAVIGSSRV